MLEFARQRIQAVLAELERTAFSDFPYKDSEEALKSLQRLFSHSLSTFDGLDDNSAPKMIVNTCEVALKGITDNLPLIGFIVRSTATRNAFEAFGPFRRLAGDLLEPTVPVENRTIKLVFSSEWEYQPFIWDPVAQLKDFLLIGLPASESSNPLLLPLAGHELGHALWLRKNLDKELRQIIGEQVTAAIRQLWDECVKHFPEFANIDPDKLDTQMNTGPLFTALLWCTRQCEEMFCDFVGLGVFGMAFYNAFAYTLSPGLTAHSPMYPDLRTRVDRLGEAGKTFGLEPPEHFAKCIAVNPTLSRSTPSDNLLLKIAEQASAAIWPHLLEKARALTAGVNPGTDQVRLDRILARFRLVAPADNVAYLADIFNAAWIAYNDDTMWKEYPKIHENRREVLRDLVLKNLEIFEIERRLA